MSWAERLLRLSETSTFRHASLTAFVFLLMAFGSILLSNRQIENFLVEHVRDMVLADLHGHERKAALQNSSTISQALTLSAPRQQDESIALVLSPRGELLFGDSHFMKALHIAPLQPTRWHDVVIQDNTGRPVRIYGMQLRLRDGGIFFSAFNILPMLERVRVIPMVAGAGLLAVLLSSLAIGLYSSVRSMRRVDRIRSALRSYIGGEREASVPASSNGDELDLLGMDINNVLSRINGLMDEVKSVSSHLAHELRTPLTRLHNRLDLVAERLDGSLRHDVLEAVQEAERIQRMFKAVLRIGEIEAGRCNHSFEWFDVRALLADVMDYYQPLAEAQSITLQLDKSTAGNLLADRALVFQALSNMLENALKYAGAGASITLLVRLHTGYVDIAIADDGPGIAPELRAEAMKRFRRLHGSEHSGSGLGLALVSAIAKLHSGELVLQDNEPRGLIVALRLAANHWATERTTLSHALRS
ncbi:HAMP domain-containing histidine kinase [Curvibacter sp. CHRR-16]|uniref:sensor histidine kinase n=1 Tax=Curvibacter sp. CHRR-16 TaxID=2835872 RepID=UPI001BDAB195|nr:HAMP domain-containing sensor histidine kinase [Curvibacter sp. CHRR-16]MBT0570719.1 HAMP domain-containing histidine kinase [Curvibacter sp. CHRR-16]